MKPPYAPVGWSADGWPFMRRYADEYVEPEDFPGIWHVTTAAPRVLEVGRLMSRQQIGKTQGLGGGPLELAPNMVSVITRPENALRLARAMQIAALATRDRIPAWVVAWEALEWSSWEQVLEVARDMQFEYDSGNEDDISRATTLEGDIRRAEQCLEDFWGGRIPESRKEARSRRYHTSGWSRDAGFGRSRYDLLRNVEMCVSELRTEVANHDYNALDGIMAPVGFTSNWTDVNPRHVRVVRLAGRLDARTYFVPSEDELRFAPEDLLLLGLESPKGLVPKERT